MESIIVAIIGGISSILAAFLPVLKSKRSNASNNKSSNGKKSAANSRIIPIFNLGVSLTTLAVVITIIFPLSRVEEYTVSPPLSQFLDSPSVPEIENLKKADVDAQAILMGAGPKELTIDNIVRKTGDILYVRYNDWVDIVFPTSKRNDLSYSETCIIDRGKKLTIMGFSLNRKSVLFQYETHEKTGGTSCDNGTYFFQTYEKSPTHEPTQRY